MLDRSRAFLTAVALLCFTSATVAQSSQSSQTEGTGSISGRITLGGKPMPGVFVELISGSDTGDHTTVSKTTTDAEGTFRLAGLAPDRYEVRASAPGYVAPREGPYGNAAKVIALGDGETVDGVEIALARGGVITGRVTNVDGRPVIGERVQLELGRGRTRDAPAGRQRPQSARPPALDRRPHRRPRDIPDLRIGGRVVHRPRGGHQRLFFGDGWPV
jgi:hypothetical protein